VVIAPNPRGSSGRGYDFARAIRADWGHKDVEDVLAAVDHVASLGVVDTARLGVGGRSYGGILTNYVIASDARFKAAVSGAGSSNALATYGSDMYVREVELELGTPWANREVYERVSYPFFHADRIATPTLFYCAEKDFNVPCHRLRADVPGAALARRSDAIRDLPGRAPRHGRAELSQGPYGAGARVVRKYLGTAEPAASPRPARTPGSN
jgi:dienelactone hydrolase